MREHLKRKPENDKEKVKESKDWREVVRKHEVVAIGDLHGRYEAFLGNGTYAGILEKGTRGNVRWTGGDKRAVFLGDILGDRGMDGFEILANIDTLKKEAKKSGGELTVLAGNHDNWMLSFLLEEEEIDGAQHDLMIHKIFPIINGVMINQGMGLLAMVTLLNELGAANNIPDKKTFLASSQNQQYSLAHAWLTNAPLWKTARREIASSTHIQRILSEYAIVHLIDDTLFLHCDPTTAIVEDLLTRTNNTGSLTKAVHDLNATYQENLKRCFNNPQEKPDDAYRQITQTYLATGNRRAIANPNTIKKLREEGVNAIVHGHTEPAFGLQNMKAEKFPEKFLIMTADQGAYKEGRDRERSAATIATDGKIRVGETNLLLRE